ncbi:MAG: sigma-54-dependent Fis family transcriptional regulator [bacterium]|nr:sigma-54-dependent Fis family transcriptional regulator [bacterium]
MARSPEDSPLQPTPSNHGELQPTPALAGLLDWVARAARTELPVLVQGETGAGKEVVARTLHRQSRRRDGPFVAVNCTALADTLLDAELFGSERGAYTGAERTRPGLFVLADGGTLFLDEVGDMSASMQSKLLRAIQEKRIRPVGADREVDVDVRIVAATHHDLRSLSAGGLFRADLYFRLSVVPVRIPPLRERIDDLAILVDSLSPRLAAETGLGPPRVDEGAWRLLRSYDWPGNVRELHAVLARALLRSSGETIRPEHLDGMDRPASRTGGNPQLLEHEMIRRALRESGNRITEAARRIGWSRQKLYRRMGQLELRATAHESGPTTSSDSSTFQ